LYSDCRFALFAVPSRPSIDVQSSRPDQPGERYTVIRLKRAYDKPARSDGKRVLVERLWPRGVSKSEAKLDLWLKDIAPTPALRKWFNHEPARWEQFRTKYFSELRKNKALDELRQLLKKGIVTFVYAARDEQHNAALALKQYLEDEA
jgi:uncharacterized protein YeaO (DUF488 family)